MSGIQDLLQTIVQKRQLDLQTAAQTLAQQQLVTQQQDLKARVFDNLSRVLPMLSPEQRQAYALGVGHTVGLDDQTASTLAQGVGTASERTSGDLLAEIAQDPTLRPGLKQRLATGETPSQAEAGRQYIGLPEEEKAYGARVSNRTALGAPDQAQHDVALANIRQGYKALENQWNIAQLEYRARLASAQDPMRAGALLDNLTTLLKQAASGSYTKEGAAAFNAAINAHIEALAGQGIIVPMYHLDKDGKAVLGLNPDAELVTPGFFGAMKSAPGNFFQGSVNYLRGAAKNMGQDQKR